MVKLQKQLELIGKNIAAGAFQEKLQVSQKPGLVELLRQRYKSVEEKAREKSDQS